VCCSGTYLSIFLDSAPGPTIVVLFALLLVVAFIYSQRRDRNILLN
ncbi:metal ABC transporter permease, partial [Erwinia amylovora]